ncbi:MAG: hypothetical protein WCT77_12235, partial [Bacteroidota bacterium]
MDIKPVLPRILVLGAFRGKVSSSENEIHQKIMDANEAWALAFKCPYIYTLGATKQSIENADIVIANSDYIKKSFIPHLVNLAENRPAHTKWVTLIEGDAEFYLKPQDEINRLFAASDLIICINKFTLSFFQSMTKTKCVFIGVPYPIDEISKFTVPFEKRERKTLICSWLLRRNNDYLVARELGIPYYGYEKRIHRTMKLIIPNLKQYG